MRPNASNIIILLDYLRINSSRGRVLHTKGLMYSKNPVNSII
jgi:hypothetical protein